MVKDVLGHCEATEEERKKMVDPSVAGLNKYWCIERKNFKLQIKFSDQRYTVPQTHQDTVTNREETGSDSDQWQRHVIGGEYLNPIWRQTLATMTDQSKQLRLSLLMWTPARALPTAASWVLHCMVHWHPAKLTLLLSSFTLTKLWKLLFNYNTGTWSCVLGEML